MSVSVVFLDFLVAHLSGVIGPAAVIICAGHKQGNYCANAINAQTHSNILKSDSGPLAAYSLGRETQAAVLLCQVMHKKGAM